jgi:hypothetical protein
VRIDTAIVTILGVRMALAFPHASYIGPGAGDVLIQRLMPYFRTLPIMLVLFDDGDERAYAPFQAQPFFAALKLDDISLTNLDLSQAPADDEEPPF